MRECIERFFEKVSDKVSSSPSYVKFIRKRDIVAEYIKNALLACFSAIGPVWNFLFLETPDPNSLSDEPVSSSETDTRSPGCSIPSVVQESYPFWPKIGHYVSGHNEYNPCNSF